jgi:hypothetical protein
MLVSLSAKRRRELTATVISMEPAAIPQSEVTIRPAVAGDAAAITRIWLAGWTDGHLDNVPDALLAFRDEASFGRRAADESRTRRWRARRFYERRGWTDDGPFEYPAEGGSEPVQVPAQRYVKTL